MARIGVVIPTTGRIEVLRRAIRSVMNQTVGAETLVVGDALDDALEKGVQVLCADAGVRFLNAPSVETWYPPARTGRLRNLGCRWFLDKTDVCLLAQLDDDNELLPDHLESLARLLVNPEPPIVAYSWRQIVDLTGEPMTLTEYPWVLGNQKNWATRVANELTERGIFGANGIVRDPIPGEDAGLCHVDSSEMMLSASAFEATVFREQVSLREAIYQMTEDYLYCEDALRAGIKFVCSEQVTLKYYLGGGYHGRAP